MNDLALFTIAQDEIDLLPVWLGWHRQYAPEASIFVLDHDSRGDAAHYLTTLADATVVPVRHRESFDYDWLARTVEDFMAFLLRSFSTVGFCEVDELLWPWTKNYPTLEAVLASEPGLFVRAEGLCLVHHYPEEPDMDWNQRILQQRRHWYPSQRYSKICLASSPVYYENGFHGAYNVSKSMRPSHLLKCIHLHQADYRTTLRRHQRNAGRFWSSKFRLSSLGRHQRLDNPAELERYLLCNLDNPEEYAQLREVSDLLKEQECQLPV